MLFLKTCCLYFNFFLSKQAVFRSFFLFTTDSCSYAMIAEVFLIFPIENRLFSIKNNDLLPISTAGLARTQRQLTS